MTTQARPGQPEGRWWHPLAYLGALLGAGLLGWAIFAGLLWFVWAYTLVAGSILGSLAVVTLVAYLACKRGWRPKVAAAALFAVLVVFVLGVLPR